eukprot:Colp12_sorted_trinity150504_noHs@14340
MTFCYIVPLFVFLFLVPARGLDPYTNGVTSDSIVTPDGRTRTFNVFVPSTQKNSSLPLVVFLHGGLGTGLNAMFSYGMNTVASTNTFIVVYPDGFEKTWNAGLCCGMAMLQNVDDVGFIQLMVQHIARRAYIDANRIYATGMSNGAIMSHRLACELPTLFAAIAPVEGTIGITSSCTAAVNSPSVLNIHGTWDTNVPWEGGYGCGVSRANFNSIPYTINFWINKNKCSCGKYDEACVKGDSEITQGDAVCTSYGSCGVNGGTELLLCKGPWGHSWPGGNPSQANIDGCNKTVSSTFLASEQIWRFFKRHSLNQAVSSLTSTQPQPTNVNTSPNKSDGRQVELNMIALFVASVLVYTIAF